jgi:antitoxin component YwqK of YwqJK toxin-antitoxin module
MALIECYECKGKVSSEAKVCPHCGLPIEVEIEYHYNGQMSGLTFLKDGKLDGLITRWYENGQKDWEANYKDGKMEGLKTDWYCIGQKRKQFETNYKDDKEGGLSTYWYFNGQKASETIYKDGKIMSAVVWKPNGEKCPVTNVKNGNGVVVGYKEDGTGSLRSTYKDFKLQGRIPGYM